MILGAFTCYAWMLRAQETRDSALTLKQKLVIGGLVVQQVGSFYIENEWWWKGDYHPFNVVNDGGYNNYSLGIDKVGHFYMSYLYFNALNEVMKWGEFRDKPRLVTSVTLPALWALSIELGDGYSTYGFSFPDLAANFMGIGYGLLQDKVPYMRNFNVKFSYIPTRRFIDNHFQEWSISEDYDGHIYWLTMNMHQVLPGIIGRKWPEFLNLGVGYGINHFTGTNMEREFFIGLDYNLSSIKTRNKSVVAVRQIMDKFHYPAPGFKKTADGTFKPQWFLLN